MPGRRRHQKNNRTTGLRVDRAERLEKQMMTDWGCKPPMKHHRKDGGSAENRQSLVSVGCARVEAAGKMKCLVSNYDPDNLAAPPIASVATLMNARVFFISFVSF
jgi:hypothetical protein